MHNKIVEFRFTKAGFKAAARESMMFGLLFCTAIDVVDFVTNDKATLGSLFGNIAGDLVKCAISVLAGLSVGALTAGAVGATVAIGPVILAVAAGIYVGVKLDQYDEKFHFSERLGKFIDVAFERLKKLEQDVGREFQREIRTSVGIIRDLSRDIKDLRDWTRRGGRPIQWVQMAW